MFNALEQRTNLNCCLRRRGQSAFCALTRGPQSSDGTMDSSHVLATVLALEVLQAKVDNAVVKVLATEVGVARRRFHFKDPILNGEQGHIGGATSHFVDKDVALSTGDYSDN